MNAAAPDHGERERRQRSPVDQPCEQLRPVSPVHRHRALRGQPDLIPVARLPRVLPKVVMSRSAWYRAVNSGDLPSVRLGGRNKPDAKELTMWTPGRARQFLAATEHDGFGPLWRLLLMTGARRGEALAQTWDSLDLDAGTMRISRSMSDTEWGQPVFVTPKTPSSRRTVSLDAATVAVLRKHRARQQAERLAFGGDYPDHGLVFVWEDGTVPHVDYVSRCFRETQQKLGWDPIRLHDLRYCHASLLLANGQPVKVVQERLGHATPAITLQVYTHTLAGQTRRRRTCSRH